MGFDINAISGVSLDQKILECAERWSGAGLWGDGVVRGPFNPVLGPLLLSVFRKQVGDGEAGDAELRPLLERCQELDQNYSNTMKIFGVVSLVFLAGIFYGRPSSASKKQQIEHLNPHSSPSYMRKSSPK